MSTDDFNSKAENDNKASDTPDILTRLANGDTVKPDKNLRPLSVYAVVSQVGFAVITPLLLFIWGGTALCDYLKLPDWVKLICIFVGIFTMLASLISYLQKLSRMYGKDKDGGEYAHLKHDRRDNDFYDDHIKKGKL